MLASAIESDSGIGTSGEPQVSRWLYALVVVLACLPYLGLASQPLVYDAPATVLRNEAVQSGSLSDLLSVDFWGYPLDADHGTRSYRPLVSVTYAVEARLFGNSPAVLHLTDVALHALAALLVVLLAESLGLGRLWAAAAGALFAVHPIQTEAVSSIVGRADLMAAVCLLGALVLHLRAQTAKKPWVLEGGTLALIAAAFFCKEYAVAFPFVLVGVDLARWWSSGRRPARAVSMSLALLALLTAYLVVRYALMGSLGGVPMLAASDHPLFEAPWIVRWSMALRLFSLAVRLLVFPVGLNHHYRQGTLEIVDSPFHALALSGLALTLGGLLIGIWWARKVRDPLPIVAWILFVLPLLPTLNLVSLGGVVFAERFLYVPVAGLALLAAFVLARASFAFGARRLGLVGLGIVLAAGTALGAKRVPDWGSDERLARSSIEAYPGGAEAWRDLGLAVGGQGRHQEAADAFERSAELAPGSPQTWQAYATALFNLGRFGDSAEAWQRCFELMPGDEAIAALYVQALLRSSDALLEQGETEQGLDLLRRASDLDPDLARQMHEVGLRLEQEARYDEAAGMYRRILHLQPDHAPTMFNLGRVLILAGRPDQSVEWLRAGLEIRPDPRAEALLEQALAAAGNPE
jgi:Flp pilus assembly protein TadD